MQLAYDKATDTLKVTVVGGGGGGGDATADNQELQLAQETVAAASLVDILAKLIAAPATEAKQGGGLPAALGASGGLKTESVLAAADTAPQNVTQVVSAGPTAAAIASPNTFCRRAIIVAKSTNVGTILLGNSVQRYIPLEANQSFSISMPEGEKTDLNDWYIYGTAGEGVNVIYTN